MFKNHFKTALRSLVRNKSYTAINIAGLAAGISICLLIFTLIRFELSFENIHPDKNRIYRVLTEYHHADAADIFYGKGVPFPMPRGLKTSFPQIEEVTSIYSDHNDQIQVLDRFGSPEKKFKEQSGVFFTGPSFFKIFSFPLLEGSYNSLGSPNNVLITKSVAEKYFGDWRSAMGKTIRLKSYSTDVLKVSGILADIPVNTDFQLKLVVSFGTGFTGTYIASSNNWDGTTSDFVCFILLPQKVSVENFNAQLRTYSRKVNSPGNKDSHIIQPLDAVHYDTGAGGFSGKTISHQLINALWMIGAFILLIACVNFINLSTAQAVNRAKDVGVRKVLGSNKWQLQLQFLAETLVIVVIAVVLAVLLSIAALPLVRQILDLPLSIGFLKDPAVLMFLVGITLVVAFLAGFYPSVVLASFNPVNALKSKLQGVRAKGVSLRRGLVVFQFIIAQALIVGTLIIVKQMNYFTSQPLGFDKNAVVNIPFPSDSASLIRLDYLRQQLSNVKGVESLSFSSNTPVEDDNDNWSTFKYDHAAKETDFFAITKFADDQYLPTYKLSLVAGRNLRPSDTAREFLVNESLVKSLGVRNPKDVLNRQIVLWGGQMKGEVVGVLRDFNDRSFRRDLAPLLVTTAKNQYNEAAIKLSTAMIPSAMKSIARIWEQVYPDFVYEYRFLDDKVESFYKQENQLAQIYKVFAGIAIFLSCLGLYGLASFMAVQRIREVGIRKVLGASVPNIVYLFSKEFIILIGIAFIIASPIAWYVMNRWLQNYVYRIHITVWIFVLGGVASFLVALATVSFQAIRAALSNPVKNLRTE
jgi:predicted permease